MANNLIIIRFEKKNKTAHKFFKTMAKLKSLLKIEGTLDGMTFYKGKSGYLVRTQGGVSKSRIENDPAFVRTRENGSEFGQIAKSGKLLRQTLTPLLVDVKDGALTARMMKQMAHIKNFDTLSLRGDRHVAMGLLTPEGKALLRGFDFNGNAKLKSILLADFQLNTATGEISIPNFNPLQQMYMPGGATHVSFTAGIAHIDFETQEKELHYSPEVNLPITNTVTPVSCTPPQVPTGGGQLVYVFKISFFQEINGMQYSLNNGAFNILQIIEVL
jgi:hypothetical protein